jgi:hypothetical protein
VRTRLALGGVGVLVGLFGFYELLQQGFDNLVATVIWLAGGVLLHDGVLAFLTIAVVAIGARVTPPRFRAPIAAGFLVLGTVTATAVPVLGRFGARSDNPTLLDRNYAGGWLVFAGLVCVVVAVSMLMSARHAAPPRREE